MHVSSKMVFHLSDSFYLALKNVDVVALELNPDLWQGQMVNLNRLKQNYAEFVQPYRGNYLTENSFRINKYEDELKNDKTNLDEYNILLVPFYAKNSNVRSYFENLLHSKEPDVRLSTAVLLLRNNLVVADSILINLASEDRYRGILCKNIESSKRLDKFPAAYKNQLDISRSYLLGDRDYDKIDSVVLLQKQPAACDGKRGLVYFFNYRANKEDDWKIGISGLQPEDENKMCSDDKLVSMTGVKIKPDEPLDEQLQRQLKKILFSFYKRGKHFYGNNDYRGALKDFENDED